MISVQDPGVVICLRFLFHGREEGKAEAIGKRAREHNMGLGRSGEVSISTLRG